MLKNKGRGYGVAPHNQGIHMQKLMKSAAISLLVILTGCSQPSAGGSVAGEQHDQKQSSTDLADLISSGEVSLVRASGNGASSGNSVDAVLRNNTGREIEVDIFMRQPIFLTNSGIGQNMIASMVLGADGGYTRNGDREVVTLRPSEQFNASMVAYCADFEKENPTKSETFAVAPAPAHLIPVVARINEHVRANPDANVTAAAQVGIWMAQGENPNEIAKKFEFTPTDEQLATEFIQ